jgi:serine/threonine protein kinase
VHRNVKPENIMQLEIYGDYSQVQVIGTLDFMSPEMLSHSGYGRSVGIWALGVVLYILLVGSFPLDERTEKSLPSRIFRGKYRTTEYDRWVRQ